MRWIPKLAAALCWAHLASGTADAQPALERLERNLQERAEVDPPAPNPGYLGLRTDDRLDPGRGTRVVEVIENGPSAQAGVRRHDLIVAAGGEPIRGNADLRRLLARSSAGARIDLRVVRGAETIALPVTLAEPPGPEQRRSAPPAIHPPPPLAKADEPPAPPAEADLPASVQARLKALEQRVLELERRLLELERRREQ